MALGFMLLDLLSHCGKPECGNGDVDARRFQDVLEPVGLGTPGGGHHIRSRVWITINDLDHGLLRQARIAALMFKQQETLAEKPTEAQPIKENGRPIEEAHESHGIREAKG